MPKMILMKELKTSKEILEYFKGKTVSDIKYQEGYSDIDIIFSDGTSISVVGEDCFDFLVEVPDKIIDN